MGDPQWVENPHSEVSLCANCLFPVHITHATAKRASEAPNAIILCANCMHEHNQKTGRKFAPLAPDEGQRAEGNDWKSKLVHAICQCWYESERGWGQRPDGFSLHLTMDDLAAYREEYWANMPDEPPDEYSKEAGEPFNVGVTPEILAKLRDSKNGVRSYKSWPQASTIVEII